MMHGMRRAIPLVLMAGVLGGSQALQAQHLPVQGCRAAISCAGPRGYSTLWQSAGESNVAFSVGVSVFDGKLRGRVVKPVRTDIDWRAIDAAVDLFIKRNALRRPRPETGPDDAKRADDPASRPPSR
jgi:hypothetical protein